MAEGSELAARLYFQKARIVILDEATSAMDNLTEEYVMVNLMEFLKDRTTIIVANRLNTVRNVDNIYVLKHGEIAANGMRGKATLPPHIYL